MVEPPEGEARSARAGPSLGAAALALLALGGLTLRVRPLLRLGVWGYAVDYDEGVYFSAASLLWRGVWPYRDFAFVHPPGLLAFLAATSAWMADPARGFAAARWVAAALGTANIWGVGRLLAPRAGWVAAVAGAAVYACFPEAVGVERGPFLEPVLNALCLVGAALWLREGGVGTPKRRPALAGAAFGAALAVKLWAGIWGVAALLSAPPRSRSRAWVWLGCGAAAAFALLCAPFVFRSGPEFARQTLLFHLSRPADGLARSGRWWGVFRGGHLTGAVLALFALMTWASGRAGPAGRAIRFFGVAYVLTLAAFVLSPAYWGQYAAHLAPSEAVLAGFGAGALWDAASKRGRWAPAALALAFAAALVPAVRKSVRNGEHPSGLEPLGAAIRETVEPTECFFALEPGWGLAAGRLPDATGSGRVVDSYAWLLLAAQTGGARYANVSEAFADPGAQAQLRSAFDRCAWAVKGWRFDLEVSAESRRWFEAHFEPAWRAAGEGRFEIWRHRP